MGRACEVKSDWEGRGVLSNSRQNDSRQNGLAISIVWLLFLPSAVCWEASLGSAF